MERSFINFLNLSNAVKNSNTTILIGYVTDPKLLAQIPKDINVHVITKKWNLFGKVHTVFYLSLSILKAFFKRNQYDCSICYSYQHGSLAKLTLSESKNNIIFVHTDLVKSRSQKALKYLIKKVKFNKFSKIICVSNKAKESFQKILPNYSGKVFTINNFINYRDIITKSHAKINFTRTTTTFLNICRHENDQNKKVSRVLEASTRLKNEGENFEVLLIGGGKEDKRYRKYILENNLSDFVKLLGEKPNPFPYYLKADAVIISSAYEGYGIVLDEARVLGVPVISTDIGDAKQILTQGYGILCENNSEGIYRGMKTFLDKRPKFNNHFSAQDFNNRINQQLNEVIFK